MTVRFSRSPKGGNDGGTSCSPSAKRSPAGIWSRKSVFLPSSGFTLEKDGGIYGRTFILTPAEPLPFDEICTLRIGATVKGISGNSLKSDTLFYFQTNGPGSLPPEVRRVTFLKDPSSGLICGCVPCGSLDLSCYVPHPGGAGTGFFDIYVRTAESASLVPTECMEHFSVELSGDCASIVPVLTETAALSAPAPDPPPQTGEQLLRVYVAIEDHLSCGTVTLRLAPGFKDSNGNRLESEWALYFKRGDTVKPPECVTV